MARASLARAWTPAERACEVWRVERGFSWCRVVLWGLPLSALGACSGAIACVSPALPASGSQAPRGVLAAAERATPAAAAPARGSSCSSSVLPSLLQRAESMAAESERSCPICHDNQDDIAYMSPCLHQFCLGCALRWARQKPSCPLCQSGTTAILFSVWSEDDYLTFEVPGPAAAPAGDHRDEEGAAGAVPRAQVGAFPPEVWADFFRSHPDNVRPLLLWLRQELEVLFDRWWEATTAEGIIVGHLCLCGLDEAVLVHELQSCLPENAGPFVLRLITTAVRLCGGELRRHLGQQDPRAAGGEDESPAASPSPAASRGVTPDSRLASSSSPAGSDVEEQPGTSEAALRGGPGRPPSAPVPAEQEQPQEEPGQAAAAGPSAQGCSRSPSAPGWGRDRSRGGPRRPPKRRAPGPQDSPQPCKRPPRRRH
ncbi:uncharacterized protein LJ206_001787 [Theristicus caerulescens]